MPIEDINYLYDHCVKDAFMFFIDSANRDRRYYPEPNHYVVTFEEPIKLVYGFDILDATMPNVMYNIDTHNNELVIVQLRSNRDESQDMAGYNMRLRTLVTEQQTNLAFRENFDVFKSYDAYILRREDWHAHPELQAYLDSELDPLFPPDEAAHDTMFILVSRFERVPLMELSSLPAHLAETYARDSMHVRFEHKGETFFVSASHALAELVRSSAIDSYHMVRDLSVDGGGTWTVTASSNVMVPRAYGDGGMILNKVDGLEHDLIMQRALTLEVGQYNVNMLQEELQLLLGPFGIYAVGTDRTESEDLVKQGRVMFTSTKHPFMLNMNISSIHPNIGFESYSTTKSKDYGHVIFNDNFRLYASIYNDKAARYQVRAPGAINLLGTRYITLKSAVRKRCASLPIFSPFCSSWDLRCLYGM